MPSPSLLSAASQPSSRTPCTLSTSTSMSSRVAETAAAVTAARRSSELEVVRGLHAAHARQTAETARGDDDACAAPRQPACAPAAPAAPAAAARGWHSKWQPGAAGVQRASFEDDAPRPSLAEKQQQKLRRDSVVRAAFGASKAAAQLSGQVARTDDGRLDVLRRILDDIDRALPSDSAAEPAPRPDDATTLQVLDDNDPRRRTIADLAVDVICAARAAAADANLDVRDEPASGRAPEVGSRGLSDGVAELIGLLYRKLVVGAAPRVRWQRALPGAGRSRLVLPQSSASSVRSDTDSTRVSFEESDTARPRAQWTGSLFTADAAQRFAVDDHAVRHMARADRPSMNVLADRPRNAPQMSAARSASVLVKGAASVPTNGADARTAVDDDEPMDDAADSRAKAAAAWRGVTELSAQLQAQPRAPPAFSAPPAFAVPPAFAAAPAFAAQAYASAPPPLAHSGVDPRARAHAAGPHAVDWARLAYEQAHHAPQPHWLFDASLHAARDLALTMQLRRAPAMTHAQLQATRPQGFVGRAAHFSVAHALAPPAGYYLPPGQWHAGPAHHAALQQPVARIEDGARGAFLR
ncbi:hypothetical protein M885DRAFT_521845 [Pelagophyceae sp. CCMP2097]|nr:hypothetical protein M885DRAFT_521845 [Pelagophyceae sp. CCMP2097]